MSHSEAISGRNDVENVFQLLLCLFCETLISQFFVYHLLNAKISFGLENISQTISLADRNG